ncbi:MAG: ABC transporter ATP-binding protein [Bdellovibrionota bacterium]|nr:ABC transporter ATP-binding protein [Bdellovibrionota bacterium]
MQSPFISLWKYLTQFQPRAIKASIYSILNKLFDIMPEILIGMALDVVISKDKSFMADFGIIDPWEQIIALGILTFFIWVGESLCEYLHLTNWRNIAQEVQHKLRMDGYSHLQNLDLSFFEDQSSGKLVSILNDDINQLERFLDGGINTLIQTMVAVVGVGGVFFYISPKIAIFAFLPIPVIILGAFWFQSRANVLYTDVRSKVGNLASRLSTNISGIMTIKSYTQEKFEEQRLEVESVDYMKSNEKAIRISSAFNPVIRMAILSGFLMTFLIGGYKVLNGELAVGSYGVLVFLTQRLLWPLTGLASVLDLYERAMASARRVLDLIHEPIEIDSGSKSAKDLQGNFEFKDVSFRYKTGPQILKNINLEIQAKKTTAFVGSTGSGKSSLVKLLLRFYDIESGEIRLDGVNVTEYSNNSIRKFVGYVSQDVFLFHGSVAENILYGDPEASFEQVEKAAEKAEAIEFINSLPNGFDTIIGERGQKLSGGQRQRLALARAILKDPPVLILDEATSAVDNETEAAIQRSMKLVGEGRTMILIAHRLSTVVDADNIYVIDSGVVSEHGKHADLISQEGIYNQLWKVQTGL